MISRFLVQFNSSLLNLNVLSMPSSFRQFITALLTTSFWFRELLKRRVISVVHLLPYRLYTLPPLEARFSVTLTLFRPLACEASIHLSLDVVASSSGLVKESTSMALV
jgi:hypothetical protein